MDNQHKIAIYGRDHETPNEIYYSSIEGLGIGFGISVGVTQKANEDCIGLSTLNTDVVLTIADGHWGNEASELAVSKVVEFLNPDVRLSKDNEARARLFPLFEQINNELLQSAMRFPGAPAAETTLIVCYIRETPRGKYLYWASFGDSYLFIFRNGELKQLNSLNKYWLGMLSKLSENAESGISLKYLSGESRYIGVASGLETGIEKLSSGDVVFLCTDGLIGSDDEVPEAVAQNIQTILSANTPTNLKAKEIVNSALMRGEIDNVSCVIFPIT
ncbi:MAG: hypothetical protein HFACDABA_00714 [Anaerolineales bacterium]|nr:hypothetical protein [Anaerolineales bacterium]